MGVCTDSAQSGAECCQICAGTPISVVGDSSACWLQIGAILPEICNSVYETSLSVTGQNKQTN